MCDGGVEMEAVGSEAEVGVVGDIEHSEELRCGRPRAVLLVGREADERADVPELSTPADVAEAGDREQLPEAIELDVVACAGAKVKERLAARIEERHSGGHVSVDEHKVRAARVPLHRVQWTLLVCKIGTVNEVLIQETVNEMQGVRSSGDASSIVLKDRGHVLSFTQ